MAIVLFAIASLRSRLGKLFNGTVVILFVITAVSAMHTSIARISPLMQYYSGVTDLDRFYLEFRKTVFETCPPSVPIYLNLNGEHYKFRQMAILYLYDREVRSDWMDDGYIYTNLPMERQTQELTAGSCVVERNGRSDLLTQEKVVGPFKMGVFDGRGKVRITSVVGAYDRESDGQNWWHWVEHKVTFKLQPLFIPKDTTQTKLHFEYGTRGRQTLTLRIIKLDGSSKVILLQSMDDTPVIFDKVIDIPPSELAEISIETNGKASHLGEQDARMAAWIILNLTITAVSQ
jgi:hypothetical protein